MRVEELSKSEVVKRLTDVYEITNDPILKEFLAKIESGEIAANDALLIIIAKLEDFKFQHLMAVRVAQIVANRIRDSLMKGRDPFLEALVPIKKGGDKDPTMN